MSRVLVSGWYGNGNLGDEAVLAGMVRAIRAADPLIEPVVLSDDPARTTREHALRARSRSRAGNRRRLLSELRALPRYRAFVTGGGGLIKDFGPNPGNVHAWVRPGMAAGRLGKPTMWYALGVDDVRHDRSRTVARRAAAQADVVSVRDRGSARALRALGVSREVIVTADPAVLTTRPRPEWRTEARPVVVVAPRRWKTASAHVEQPELEDRMLTEFAHALDALVEQRGARILLLPLQGPPGDDAAVCRELTARMTRASEARVLAAPATPSEAADVLGACQLVVGMRLHSLILAAAAAVPFYGLTYMPKVSFFAEQLGATRWTAELERAAAPGHLDTDLLAALDAGAARRPALERAAASMRRLALLDGRLLAALLSEPARLPALAAEAHQEQAELRRAVAAGPHRVPA